MSYYKPKYLYVYKFQDMYVYKEKINSLNILLIFIHKLNFILTKIKIVVREKRQIFILLFFLDKNIPC